MLIMRPDGQQEASQDSLSLRFRTEANEIDASTLGHVLLSLSTIARIVNDNANPDTVLDVRVKTSRPGSFIADLAILVAPTIPAIAPLFTLENVKSASDIIKTVLESIKLKKELKGESPEVLKDAEQNKDGKFIFQGSGQTTVFSAETINLYVNEPAIGREAGRIGSTLESDQEITGLEISDAREYTTFEVTRSEFPSLAASYVPEEEKPDTRIITRREKLGIVSISFEKDLVSRFIYLGNRIWAMITDPDFNEKINAGTVVFAKGDSLDVELKSAQEWSDSDNAYLDTRKYEITQVYRHIPRETTIPIDFDADEK